MDLLGQRKIGILPEIDIAGDSFTVDLRLNELRNVEFPGKKLPLDEMVNSADGQHYLFFYDQENRSIIHASTDMISLPQHAVLVEIPNEMGLDPVGLARKYGLSDEYFLKMHPYKKSPEARLIALEKSGLPDYVTINQKQLSMGSEVSQKQRHRNPQ